MCSQQAARRIPVLLEPQSVLSSTAPSERSSCSRLACAPGPAQPPIPGPRHLLLSLGKPVSPL